MCFAAKRILLEEATYTSYTIAILSLRAHPLWLGEPLIERSLKSIKESKILIAPIISFQIKVQG